MDNYMPTLVYIFTYQYIQLNILEAATLMQSEGMVLLREPFC